MKTILVIDDNQPFLEVICDLLSDAGFETVAVSDPERALRICSEVRFDLVICDLVMKNSERREPTFTAGMELIMSISRKHPILPIIALSGAFDELSMEKLRSLGVKCGLRKPCNFEQLIGQIETALDAPGYACAGARAWNAPLV